jgi:hypothetical protein
MAAFSHHQQKIIKNYYENRSAIALERLQELVTELYLSGGRKRAQLWKRIAGHLTKVGVKPDRVRYLVERNDPVLIAKVVEELIAKS